MRVIKFDTISRAFYTIVVLAILSPSAFAQSTLNFTRTLQDGSVNTGIAITNPTSSYANVQFTLYGGNGQPVTSEAVNPVSYRIAPKGQLSMLATEVFASGRHDGWIQATSPVSGLIGLYFSGDFSTTLDGTESAEALSVQVVPIYRRDTSENVELRIVNPGVTSATTTVTFYNAAGGEVGTTNHNLAAHAFARLQAPSGVGLLTARVTSSVPVTATAVILSSESLILVNGQRVDQPATSRIVPHFISGSGFDTVLLISNPNASPVSVNVSLLNENGGPIHPTLPSTVPFAVPAHGVASLDTRTISNLFVTPFVQGWVRIDSGNVPLAGIAILNQGLSVTAIPLQTAPQTRMLVSQLSENNRYFTGVALVNNSNENAQLNFFVIRSDGTTVVQKA